MGAVPQLPAPAPEGEAARRQQVQGVVQLGLVQATESSRASLPIGRPAAGYRSVVVTGWTTRESGEDPIEFVIGMRWHELWRLASRPWVPLAFARMLLPQPGTGLRRTRLGVRTAGPVVVQEWESRAAVDAWARDRGQAHARPWSRFRRDVGGTADWGVWHEIQPRRP
jgi:hypothetical protein